jgi:hypothetical protein
LVRALEAEELLHRAPDEAGIHLQLAERLRVAEQEIDPVANQVGGGLVPGVEDEDAVVQELELAQPLSRSVARLERAARGQLGEDLALVTTRLPPTPVDQIADRP